MINNTHFSAINTVLNPHYPEFSKIHSNINQQATTSSQSNIIRNQVNYEQLNPENFVQKYVKPQLTDRSSHEWEELYKEFESTEIPQDYKKEILTVILGKIAFAKRVERFGAKTANLQELEDLGLEVPPFIGLESKEIEAIIKKEIQPLWNEFLAAQGQNQSKLTNDAKKALKKIRQTIKKCAETNLFNSSLLTDFLQIHKHSQFAVRSTGKEDSDQLANPGGNKSVNSVAPTLSDINEACGVVLASYFSEKSFEQRIAAGDDILAQPFMPVLIQVMVGEELGGAKESKDIPASGVLFTVETEGNTPTHALAQVSFGHGEAVVDNQASSDTFYISDKDIAKKIHLKNYRRVAFESVSGRSMQSVSNPKQLQRKACLTDEQLKKLKKAGDLIHKHYGKVMDIEFVYDRSGDHLYIVQARPLQQQKQLKTPSYIELTDAFPTESIAHGDVVVVAGGEVKQLTKENCIVGGTLDQALHLYLERDDKRSVQMVLCQNKAESTSHAAGVFRSVSIPVLCVDNVHSWENSLKSGDNAIYACTQSGRLLSCKNKTPVTIEKGWFSHPVGKHFSWFNEFTDEQISELSSYWVKKIQTTYKGKSPKADPLLPKNLASLETPEKTLVRLVVKLYQFHKKNKQHSERFSTLFANILNATKNCIESKPNSMERLLYISQLESLFTQNLRPELVGSESYLTTLTSIEHEKVLKEEFDLSQVPPKRMPWVIEMLKLNRASLRKQMGKMWGDFVIEVAVAGTEEEFSSLANLVYRLQKEKLSDMWINTVLPQAFSKGKGFRDVLSYLNKDTSFSSSLQWIEHRKQTLMQWKQIIDQWVDPKAFDKLFPRFMQEMKLSSDFIQQLKSSEGMGRLALLKYYQEYLDVYDLTLKSLCDSPLYSGQEGLLASRFAAMLEPFAEMSSTVIEFAKKEYPNEFPNNENNRMPYSETYQSILSKQLELAKSFSQNNVSAIKVKSKDLSLLWKTLFDRRVLQGGETSDASYPITAWNTLSKITPEFSSSHDTQKTVQEQAKGLIELPRNFSVASANIFSNTRFIRHLPPNLAASYTLAHQNQLSVIGFMFQVEGISEQKLPESVKPFILGMNEAMKKMNRSGTRVDLISVDYHYPKMVISYNLPLRNHSSSLSLTIDFNKQEMTIAQKMFGHNLSQRMDNTVDAASLLTTLDIEGIEFTEKPHYDSKSHEMGYELKLPLQETSPDELELLGNIAYSLTGFSWMSERYSFLNQVGLSYYDPKVIAMARNNFLYAQYMSHIIGTNDWLPQDIQSLCATDVTNTSEDIIREFLTKHADELMYLIWNSNKDPQEWECTTEWKTPKKIINVVDSLTNLALNYPMMEVHEIRSLYGFLQNSKVFSGLFDTWFEEKCKQHPIIAWKSLGPRIPSLQKKAIPLLLDMEVPKAYPPQMLDETYIFLFLETIKQKTISGDLKILIEKALKSTEVGLSRNTSDLEVMKKHLFPYIDQSKHAILEKLIIVNPTVSKELLFNLRLSKKVEKNVFSEFFTEWMPMVVNNYLTESEDSMIYKEYINPDSFIFRMIRGYLRDSKPDDKMRKVVLDAASKIIYHNRNYARNGWIELFSFLTEEEQKKYQLPQPIPLLEGASIINNLDRRSGLKTEQMVSELIKQWGPFALAASESEVISSQAYSRLWSSISSIIHKYSTDPEIDELRKKLIEKGLIPN